MTKTIHTPKSECISFLHVLLLSIEPVSHSEKGFIQLYIYTLLTVLGCIYIGVP